MTNSREVSPSRRKDLKKESQEAAHQSGSSGDFFRPNESGSSRQKEAERDRQQEQTPKLSIRATSPVGGSEKRLLVNPEKPQEFVYGEEARFMLTANERIGVGPTRPERPEEQRMTEEKFEAVRQALLVKGEKSYTDQETGWKFDLEEKAGQAKQPGDRIFDPIRHV